MHLFYPGPLFGPWANAKRAIPEKLKSVPRPCWILLISTHFDRNHCFATQGEYLSHGDVSRGHPRTIYNRSWNLTDNVNFPRTLMETLIWQSRVPPWVMDMRHQTNSEKSATGSNTHACNFNFQHTHIEHLFFHQNRSSVPGHCHRGHSRNAEVGSEAMLYFIDFHRLWWEPWFCHPGRILEPWRCVKGPYQNNLQPVLQPHWNLEFCIYTYRNQAFSISGQTLSHGDVSQDQFWKICHLSKHPSGNFEFPYIRIEYICISFRTALRSMTRCQRGLSRKTEVGPEAMLDFIDFHTLW